jgi:putative aldouronate transport system permease protein
MVISIGIAILLNEIKNKFFTRFYQSVILLPHLISFVIISYLAYAVLSINTGFMNNTVLPFLGLNEVSWYMEAKYWPFILTFVHLWKGIGFTTLIFFAAVIGISEEYYEAARLDGASKWQQIFKITIPLITPVIILLTLLNIGRIFYADFGLFYQVPMNSGALFDTTNVIDTYVFRGLIGLGDISMATAAGVYQSFVGFILVLVANYIIRKVKREDALF